MATSETAKAIVEGDTRSAIRAMKLLAASVNQTAEHTHGANKASEGLDKGLGGVSGAAGLAVKALGVAGLALSLQQVVRGLDAAAERSFQVKAVFGALQIGIDGATEATMGLVDSYTLAQQANRAVRFGVVETGEEFATAADAAVKLGLSVGQDATSSVEDLIVALGRQSPMILDNLGITLKLSDAHSEYAKRIGKSVKDLNDAEKAEAFRVIGLEKAVEASRDILIETDTLAASYKKLKIAAKDTGDQLLGADSTVGELREAFRKLNDEQKGLVDQAGTFGAAEKDLTRAFREQGYEIRLTAEMMAVLRAERRRMIRMEAAEEVRKQREAEKKQREEHIKQLEEQLELEEHDLALMRAGGAAAKEDLDARLERTNRLFDRKLAIAQAEEDQAKVREIQREREVALLEAVTDAEERSAGAGRSAAKSVEDQEKAWQRFLDNLPVQDLREVEQAMADLDGVIRKFLGTQDSPFSPENIDLQVAAMDRQIARMQSLGQEAEFMLRRRAQVAAAANDAAGQHAEADKIRFEEELRRNRARTESAEAHAKKMAELTREQERLAQARARAIGEETRQFAAAMHDAADAAARASGNKKKAFLEELEAFAFAKGRQLIIEAAYHAVQAAVAFASYNYVKAAGETAAAGIATAKAAAFLTGAIVADAMGDSLGGGGGGREESIGAPRGFGGGGRPGGSPRSGDAPDVPLSPLQEDLARTGQAANGAGGTQINITVQGSVVGSKPADIGQWVLDVTQEAQRVNGVVNG